MERAFMEELLKDSKFRKAHDARVVALNELNEELERRGCEKKYYDNVLSAASEYYRCFIFCFANLFIKLLERMVYKGFM